MRDFLKWAFHDAPDWVPFTVLLLAYCFVVIWIAVAIVWGSLTMASAAPLFAMWLVYREYKRSRGGDG